MIPLVDDFIRSYIVEKVKWLKKHPKAIDIIFHTSSRETLDSLRDFLTNQKVRVIIGYPREQTSLPAYVITQAPEEEQPSGIGDNSGIYEGQGLGIGYEEATGYLDDFISSTFMVSTVRVECWSDNGDLTAMMYTILKWCLWGARPEMIDNGWNNIKLSGTDLEPVPDYMPVFIYRRALQVSFTYDNLYFNNLEDIQDVIDHPEKYQDGRYDWVFRILYYDQSTGEVMDERELAHVDADDGAPTAP